MNDRFLLPPLRALACYHCSAWRQWDKQAVCREGSKTIEYEPTGQCRAHPPSIDRRSIGGTNGDWPVVAASDWCLNFALDDAASQTERAA